MPEQPAPKKRRRTAATPATPPGRRTLSEQLRSIVSARGTAFRAAKDAGLDVAVLYRFMSGERGLSSASIDQLGLALGLELRERTKPRAAAGKTEPRT